MGNPGEIPAGRKMAPNCHFYQALLAPSQSSGPDSRPIGATAVARMKAAREVNDVQDEPWRNHDAFFGMGQDFSNYRAFRICG